MKQYLKIIALCNIWQALTDAYNIEYHADWLEAIAFYEVRLTAETRHLGPNFGVIDANNIHELRRYCLVHLGDTCK